MASESVMLTIAGNDFTQSQAARLAFEIYIYEGFHFDQAYVDWDRIAQGALNRKDFGFLLLYFLDKVADDEVKALCVEDVEKIKKEINR